jgi:transposase
MVCLFRRDALRYDPDQDDPDQDVDICPAGQTLSPNHAGKARDLKKKIDFRRLAPPVRCVRAARPICAGSRVWRTWRRATAGQPLKARPESLDRRRETIEPPFGSIKQGMNPGAFMMRGLANGRAAFGLTARVDNLRRALNIFGVATTMAAVPGVKG